MPGQHEQGRPRMQHLRSEHVLEQQPGLPQRRVPPVRLQLLLQQPESQRPDPRRPLPRRALTTTSAPKAPTRTRHAGRDAARSPMSPSKTSQLPGLIVAPRPGPGPFDDDSVWTEGLRLTSERTPRGQPRRLPRSRRRCNGVAACSVLRAGGRRDPSRSPCPSRSRPPGRGHGVTAAPLNTMLTRSPRPADPVSGATFLSAASLSPVSEASAIISEAASTRHTSAATASPSTSSNTAPGTTSVDGTRSSRPSRAPPPSAAGQATACSARASWTYPSTALRTTMTRITMTSNGTRPGPPRSTP